MIRATRGSALAMMLILLSGLGALALAAAAAAATALALAGHEQDARLALESAEAGVEYALAYAADSRSEWESGDVAWPQGMGPQSVYRTRTSAAVGPGAEPEGFSLGEGPDTFAASHFFVVADGRAGRNAAVRVEQGFYLVVPGS